MTNFAMRKLVLMITTAALLSGCNVLYRQPVYQGTLFEQKNVEQLKVGMSQQEVYGLLGSPPIADPFHQSRWDYTASQRKRYNKAEIKNMTVFFENGAVTKWEGDYFPEQDLELAKDMRKFGNLPKDKDKKRRR
jgi:outer membrane protein assembly factor BamE